MSATYLACLTPPGTGAIATLALRGPAAWTMVCELAQTNLPTEPQPGGFRLARLGDAKAADEVVVAVKQSSPELHLELHCHGGQEVVRLLLELLVARGGELCTWQKMESLTHGAPLREAALSVLANALTARTAAIALDQFQGACGRALAAIREALQGDERHQASRKLEELQRFNGIGCHLATPWRVVIAGAPNVGKSSLVNALAGYQRSIVSPIPGTTRDVVTTLLALDGWPMEIADTAGWRPTESALEQEGITRARQAVAAADLCLWLLDAASAPMLPDANLGRVRLVINKVDVEPAWPLESVDAIRVSAKTALGLDDLCQCMVNWLVPEVPPPGAALPFSFKLASGIAEIAELTRTARTMEALDKLENLCRECD